MTSCFHPDCPNTLAWEVSAPRVEARLATCRRHLGEAVTNLMIHTHPQQGKRVVVSPIRKVNA